MKNYGFVYKSWWKILGLLVLLYVFIAGFWVPLRPGILSVSELQLKAGEPYSIDVATYNGHFNDPTKELSAYIKIDSVHITKVPYVMVTERNSINLRGTLPQSTPGKEEWTDAVLVLHDKEDGFLVYPPGFVIERSQSTTVDMINASTWSDQITGYEFKWSFKFPFVGNLYETVRNTFFHVAIWMAQFVLLFIALIYSIRYLRSEELVYDAVASSFTHVAVGLGALGIITGSIWAKATWGTYWTDDPKLNMSAVAMMIYLAYSILRSSMPDTDKRAKVSAAYNIFAFVAMIPLIFIIPRLDDSMHPGNGGNPALGGEDMDSTLRLVFYPAIIGYTLLGVWISSLLFRLRRLEIARVNRFLRD